MGRGPVNEEVLEYVVPVMTLIDGSIDFKNSISFHPSGPVPSLEIHYILVYIVSVSQGDIGNNLCSTLLLG